VPDPYAAPQHEINRVAAFNPVMCLDVFAYTGITKSRTTESLDHAACNQTGCWRA
jgi:hypothetical protein